MKLLVCCLEEKVEKQADSINSEGPMSGDQGMGSPRCMAWRRNVLHLRVTLLDCTQESEIMTSLSRVILSSLPVYSALQSF